MVQALGRDLHQFGIYIPPEAAEAMINKGWSREELLRVDTVKFSIPQNNLKDFGIKIPRGSMSIQGRSL